MNFSEAATEGVLWKKLFLKIAQYSQASSRPATLSPTQVFSSKYCKIIILRTLPRTSTNDCFWFFKTAIENRWVIASVLTLLLSSDNLITSYAQLRFNNSIEIYQFLFH